MLKVATIFSGIGAIEHALKIMNVEHEIEFACDNGERNLKIEFENIYSMTRHMDNRDRNEYIKKLYDKTKKINWVEESYLANYKIKNECFYQDVRFVDGNEYKNEIDLFVGGSPCQSFSIMGKRRGLEEARGTLFYEYARLVNEIRPKVFIYENVTGMLNHDGGKTWEVISRIFDDSNYCWNMMILNAKDFGVPQNRKRIFVVGFREDQKIYFEKFKEPQSVVLKTEAKDYLESDIPNKYYLPEKGFKRVIDPKHKKHVALNGKIARCQVACQQYNWFGDMRFETNIEDRLLYDERIYKGEYNGTYGVARCLTPRECLRLMGFKDDFNIVVNDQQMYRQVGNSIAVNVLEAILKSLYDTGVFGEQS